MDIRIDCHSLPPAKKELLFCSKDRGGVRFLNSLKGEGGQILPLNIIKLFIQSNRDSCFHHITSVVNIYYSYTYQSFGLFTGLELTFQSCIVKNANKVSLLVVSSKCTSSWACGCFEVLHTVDCWKMHFPVYIKLYS